MFHKVLGVPFVDDPASVLVTSALNKGGLVTVPSGPGLAVDLRRSADYRSVITEADFSLAVVAVPDHSN